MTNQTTQVPEAGQQTLYQSTTDSRDTFITTYIRTIVDELKHLNDDEQVHFFKEWLLIEHIDALDEHEQVDQHIANIKKWINYTKDDMRKQAQASAVQHG